MVKQLCEMVLFLRILLELDDMVLKND